MNDLSQQSRDMIAVRDSRDRAAFGRLFDHFAPRLKAMMLRGGQPCICLATTDAPLRFRALIPRLLQPIFRI